MAINIASLTAEVAALKTSIDALIAQGSTSAADQAAVDGVTAQVTALKTEVDAALTPPAAPAA